MVPDSNFCITGLKIVLLGEKKPVKPVYTYLPRPRGMLFRIA